MSRAFLKLIDQFSDKCLTAMKLRKNVPTLLDVAKRAGVHKNTVSVALNSRRATTIISEETRQRIQSAVAELGYRPNAVARSLRRQSTNCIGFYRYSELGAFYGFDPFNAAIITGLSAECHRLHKDLMMPTSFPRERAEEVYLELTSGKVDGLVLLPLSNDPLGGLLANSHLPVVAIADAVPGLPSVTVDDAGGSRLIAAHLAEKGHRRVLYRNEGYISTSTQRRLQAFLDAAVEYGMEVTLGNLNGRSPDLEEHEKAFLQASSPERPAAVVCWTDYVARRVIDYCHDTGLRVPESVAVVGFDGNELHCQNPCKLTTVRAPWEYLAATAVKLVVDISEGKEVLPETILPVSLVTGDTT